MLKKPKPEPETLALQALAFLVAEEERLNHFIDSTGIDPGTLPRIAHDPASLGAILDYLLNGEALLIEFAESIALDPSLIVWARQKLPGALL